MDDVAWDPARYLAFAGPRLRPALDLLARVPLDDARTVIDLGCGPGNVIPCLRRRYPGAAVAGVDGSKEMLARARRAHPDLDFIRADLAAWAPDAPVDLIFSNAALQWLDGHDRLFPRLMGSLRPGGVLAVQMSKNGRAPSHRLVGEVAREGPWAARLRDRYRPFPDIPPASYYAWLAPHAAGLDIWETEYLHALEGDEPVFRWAGSSTLLPALAHLSPDEAAAFTARYREAVRRAYPPRPDGRTLFPFRRIFVVATARG